MPIKTEIITNYTVTLSEDNKVWEDKIDAIDKPEARKVIKILNPTAKIIKIKTNYTYKD